MTTTKKLGWGVGLAAALALGTANAQSAPGSAGQGTTGQDRGSSMGSGSSSDQAGQAGQTGAGTATGSDQAQAPATGAQPSEQQGSAGAAGAAEQQGSAAAQGSTAQKPLPKDLRAAVEKLHAGNQAEAHMGQMAEQQAQSQQVKDFAKKVAEDHQRNDEKLQQMAQSLGLASLEGKDYQKATKDQDKSMKKLEGKQGAQFDKAYMDMMVKDHEKDTKDVEKAAKKAQKSDPQLAQFLQQTDDAMKGHLQEAKQLQKQVKSEGKGQSRQGRRGSQTSGSSPTGMENSYGAGMHDETKATGEPSGKMGSSGETGGPGATGTGATGSGSPTGTGAPEGSGSPDQQQGK